MKGYLSIRETSYKWGVSERWVNQYITEAAEIQTKSVENQSQKGE